MQLILNLKRIKFRCSIFTHVLLWISMFFLSGQVEVFAGELDAPITLQSRTVQGTVTDDTGDPLIGVNVIVKGTANGIITDVNGSFTLNIPNDNAVLVFSFIGFITQEITVGNSRSINVTLLEDAQQIEEVVVIGYGTQSRAMLTTSVSKVDNKVLENIPYTSVASALQGSVSGVRVQSISGQPGEAPRVIVRGGTNIDRPNEAYPLYIIDGVIREDMNDISADNIESMQVLKDAASTSIYGARGSNGVVIITTKTGKPGNAKINYRYDLTFSKVGKLYKMANARDYLTLFRSGMVDPRFPDNMLLLSQVYPFGTGNDLTNNTAFSTQYLTDANKYKLNEGWQSMPDPVDPSKTLLFSDNDFAALMYRTGTSHNHHVEASGGNDRATFNMGLGYMTNEGTTINTGYRRTTFNLSGTLKATDRLSFTGRISYSDAKIDTSPLAAAATHYRVSAPTTKLYFEDGSLAPGMSSSLVNPLYFMYLYDRDNNTERMTASFNAIWKILPQLTFTPQISVYNTGTTERNFTPAFWNGPTTYNTQRTATASLDKWRQYQIEGVFNYTETFLSDHNIGAMAGFSYYNRGRYRFNATGRGASSDLIPTLNASAEPTVVNSTVSDHLMMGYFGRINYNYKQRYLLSLNARFDGASNLGEQHKWGFFPGVSIGWIVDKEKFWNFMPDDLLKLKLRASYGVNGNISRLGDFAAQGEYAVIGTGANAISYRYMGNSAILMSTMANQDLRWERSKTTDIGMDLGLFKGRVNILFDYFNRVTDDLITNMSMPFSSGFNTIQTNLGSLQNRGIEFEINANVFHPKNKLQWHVSFNASKVSNKILKLPPNGIENNRIGGFYVYDPALGDYAWKGGLQEGGRIGDMYAYKQVSIYATDEEAANAPKDMIITMTDRKLGGDTNWLDVDGNGIIDDRDRVYMGNNYPTWTGGFANTLSYKGFNFYLRMDYMIGHTIYNYAKGLIDYNYQGNNGTSQDVVDRSWKKQGDIAAMPKLYWGTEGWLQNTFRGSSLYHEKGDFLCIREVALSYQVPTSVMNRIKLQGLRLTVTGNNLHYFTKFKGLNPEEGGQDNGRYAMPKNVIFSANITF